MAKAKNSLSGNIISTAGLWATRALMLILGLSFGLFLGVAFLAKVVWEIVDQEVDGVVTKQEGNMVTLKDKSGQEYTYEIEFKKGQKYELDGTFQGKKIILTDVDQD